MNTDCTLLSLSVEYTNVAGRWTLVLCTPLGPKPGPRVFLLVVAASVLAPCSKLSPSSMAELSP
jgi:hypothetical protein